MGEDGREARPQHWRLIYIATEDARLSPFDVRYLAWLVDRGSPSWWSREGTAERLGVHPNSISRSRATLAGMGYLRRERAGHQGERLHLLGPDDVHPIPFAACAVTPQCDSSPGAVTTHGDRQSPPSVTARGEQSPSMVRAVTTHGDRQSPPMVTKPSSRTDPQEPVPIPPLPPSGGRGNGAVAPKPNPELPAPVLLTLDRAQELLKEAGFPNADLLIRELTYSRNYHLRAELQALPEPAFRHALVTELVRRKTTAPAHMTRSRARWWEGLLATVALWSKPMEAQNGT